jgi:hypothetical protein
VSDGTSVTGETAAPGKWADRPIEPPPRECHRVAVEREGLMTAKLFVAASFIAFCVLAVAFLGTAA